MAIAKDDFELWRGHPVTEAVTRALTLLAERNKQKWIEVSWGAGETTPLVLADLKARAEMAQDLSELTFEELEDALNENETAKPERHKPD